MMKRELDSRRDDRDPEPRTAPSESPDLPETLKSRTRHGVIGSDYARERSSRRIAKKRSISSTVL
jgi:hypothetical protein